MYHCVANISVFRLQKLTHFVNFTTLRVKSALINLCGELVFETAVSICLFPGLGRIQEISGS